MEYFIEGGNLDEFENVHRVADRIRVTDTALIWHLYNLGFIHDSQRETLLSGIGFDRTLHHIL